MMKYKQLTYADMVKIETLLEEGVSIPQIAVKLGKQKTTIYRCLPKGRDEEGVFHADKAWERVQENKYSSHQSYRILSDSFLEEFVITHIQCYWSPEEVAGVWKKDYGEALSPTTLYEFIYRHHPELVRVYFRRKGKKYQRKRKEKYQIDDRRMIDERPVEVEERKTIGHWEGDTIVGKSHKQGILTNVERKSGFLFATKMKKRTAEAVLDATEQYFAELPEELRLSITYDNGREFAWHKFIEKATNMTVYFAHAYSPWERGSSENINGLLRQFIPKGTDLDSVPEEQLQWYVHLLNSRPRKRHGYLTPYEIITKEIAEKVALDSEI